MKDRRNLLLLCGSLLVAVALFEIGVRLSGLDYNLSPNWRYHPVLGWSQVPNGSYDVAVEGRPVHVSFNALGFRDVDHQVAKPAGVKRIVVIGDSFCEAIQVNLEETFQKQLERLLNADSSARWEVINLGVGDFGTAQAWIALNEYGLAYRPDVVIQQIFPLNDICNNALGLYSLCRSHNDRYRPYFVEEGGGLKQTSGAPLLAWLRRHVVTYQVLEYWKVKLVDPDPHSPRDPGRLRRMARAGFTGLDPLLYTFVPAAEQPEAVAQGWRVTELLTERIVSATRERGMAYLGMVVPFETVLLPEWEAFAAAQPAPRMQPRYAEQRLDSLFNRLGVPSVMLYDEFQPYLTEVLPFVGGHLNVAGHRRAAEALYRRLVEAGIAGSPPAPQNARARSSR